MLVLIAIILIFFLMIIVIYQKMLASHISTYSVEIGHNKGLGTGKVCLLSIVNKHNKSN